MRPFLRWFALGALADGDRPERYYVAAALARAGDFFQLMISRAVCPLTGALTADLRVPAVRILPFSGRCSLAYGFPAKRVLFASFCGLSRAVLKKFRKTPINRHDRAV